VLPTFKPEHPPLKYSTSVSFALIGVALMLRGRLPRLSALLAGFVGLVGLLLTAEYATGLTLGAQELIAHITQFAGALKNASSAPSSLCFAVAGTVLGLAGTRVPARIIQLLAWTGGAVVFSLGCIALVGYLFGLAGTYVWEQFAGMSVYAATGMCVLGFALVSAHLGPRGWRSILDDHWLALPVAVVTFMTSLIFWHSVRAEQSNAITTSVQVVAEDLRFDTQTQLGFPQRAIGRIAKRWTVRGGTPYAELSKDVANFLADEPNFVAVSRVDASQRIAWIYPEEQGADLIGRDMAADSRWDARPALERARDTGKTVMSPVIRLAQGMDGILIYSPIHEQEVFAGFIVGAVDVHKYLDLILSEPGFKDFEITIMQGDWLLAGPPAPEKPAPSAIIQQSEVQFDGLHWRFLVRARESMLARNSTRLPIVVILFGSALAAGLGVATHSLQRVREVSRENRLANERLRETAQAEKTARALLETAGQTARLGHWTLWLGEEFVEWSAVTYDIHEVAQGTKISLQTALDFYRPEDRPIVEAAVQKSLETREPFEFELRIITAKGREVWVHSEGMPEYDEAGKPVLMRGIFQDVDVRHKVTELLQERNRLLEEATEEARAHARAKAEFLANMSHEIRTPLNAIIGMSELLNDSTKDRRQKEFIDTIRTSGDILLSLINDILDFSKIEAGQLTLERAPVDVQECVESVLDLASPQASRKQLELLYWKDAAVPAFIYGDVTRLRQILVNLVSNAVKFTESGQVYVRIGRRVEDGREMVHVSVKDTGIGIPGDRQNRLFSAFSQVDASTSRRFGGTGLGLAICHRLIGIMGGRVWVDSEEGKGADFQFTIPLEEAPPDKDGAPAPGEVRSLKDLRVLIVDDNDTNRWILSEQASRWDMKPKVTAKPSEALSWVSDGHEFDLAILDGHMPEMTGYQLAEKLRQMRSQKELSIIILSSMHDHRQDTAKLGISELLTKPVKVNALEQAIAIALSREAEQTSPGTAVTAPRLGEECPLKILVAEDNSVNQRVITLLLERLGYRPEIVANGIEVLAALKRKAFDVVLLDVQMPEMDGLEAASEICRRFAPEVRPYMIALTANAGEGERQRCLDAGMHEYLSKPIRSSALSDALRSAHGQLGVAVADT
jgi:signal transduction histidine kinase/DNA-binding response OmpR family regulator